MPTCLECQKQMSYIGPTHLRQHDLTPTQYDSRHGTTPHQRMTVRGLSKRQQAIKIINDNPEIRERSTRNMADRVRKMWLDPDYRQKRNSAVSRTFLRKYRNPEWRKAARQKLIDHNRSQAGREKSSEIIRAFNRDPNPNKFKMKATSIELWVRDVLDSLHVKYRSNASLPGFFETFGFSRPYDIVIDSLKLVIEVDGCYWHACPQCFPFPNQKGLAVRDRDRLIDERTCILGWKILRVTEHEIATSTLRTRNNIIKALE
jgi:DNA mismatch endonuclease (patch repair protein)